MSPRLSAACALAWRLAALAMLVATGAFIAYTCATDGSPFRAELLTPWMVATLADFYGIVALLAVVIIAVEEHAAAGAGWVVAVCLLGSPAAWAWALKQLISRGAGNFQWAWITPSAHAPAPLAGAARSGSDSEPPRGAFSD